MLNKYNNLLTGLALLASLILCIFVAQQHQQIQELTAALDEQSPTRVTPYEARDFSTYQRDTDAKILEIEGQLGKLRRRQQELAAQDARAGTATLVDFDATRAGGLSEADQRSFQAAISDPDNPLRAQLQEVMREENARQRDERHQQRLTRWLEDLEQDFETFATAQSLTPDQREVVLTKLKSERTQFSELMRARRAGDMDREEVREQFDAIRAETNMLVERELDEDQYEAFSSQREQQFARFERGRGSR